MSPKMDASNVNPRDLSPVILNFDSTSPPPFLYPFNLIT
jgi:hypothetical protein